MSVEATRRATKQRCHGGCGSDIIRIIVRPSVGPRAGGGNYTATARCGCAPLRHPSLRRLVPRTPSLRARPPGGWRGDAVALRLPAGRLARFFLAGSLRYGSRQGPSAASGGCSLRSQPLTAALASAGWLLREKGKLSPLRERLQKTPRKLDRKPRSSYPEHLGCFSL